MEVRAAACVWMGVGNVVWRGRRLPDPGVRGLRCFLAYQRPSPWFASYQNVRLSRVWNPGLEPHWFHSREDGFLLFEIPLIPAVCSDDDELSPAHLDACFPPRGGRLVKCLYLEPGVPDVNLSPVLASSVTLGKFYDSL